jgi:predicted nucleic acid-binding protein
MPFVVDASVAAGWCFPDEHDAQADAAIDRFASDPAVVPALWWFEIRNVLIVSERRGRIDAAGTAAFLADLGRLPIHIDSRPESEIVLTLARKHRLTAYDAAYLELALRLDAPLATLDRPLAIAAAAEGVDLIAGPEP